MRLRPRPLTAAALLCLAASGCSAGDRAAAASRSVPAEGGEDAGAPRPEPPSPPAPPDLEADAASADAPIGRFALTYYWITSERGKAERSTPLFAPSCEPIARVSKRFAERLAMEGTGRLRDGRVVNVAGPCECDRSPCFFVPRAKRRWGVGVGERPLSPFRSIAVDPRLVSIGDTVYVPELDGLAMPGRPPWGGFVHDGCLVADDRGGGVRGQKVDFFTGRYRFYRALFRRHRLDQVTVYPGSTRCEQRDLRPAVAAEPNAT